MTIVDIAGDMKCGREAGDHHTHYKEASEVHFVQIFRVEEEVRDAEIFAEAPCDHCEENDPAEQEQLVAFQIV